MNLKPIAFSLCLILAACGGGGGGHSGATDPQEVPNKSAYEIWLEQGNTGTEQEFNAYQTWLSEGNAGSYQDYLLIKAPTKPGHSIQDNRFVDMSFNTLGSRDFWRFPVKIHTNNAGDITNIELTDNHDPDGWRYSTDKIDNVTTYDLKQQNGKFQSQTIYYYDLPYISKNNYFGEAGTFVLGLGFRTDKELSIDEIKETFLRIVNDEQHYDDQTKNEIIARIEALTESDAQTAPVCYDMNCQYTEKDLGHYFVSPQSLTMEMDAFGRDVGLEYSNFGAFRGTYNLGDGSLPRAYVFSGGRSENKINKDDISDTMTFSGKAVGSVLYHYSDLTDVQQSFLDVAADARLQFTNGKEELTMNFSDNQDADKRWYDVKITSDTTSNEKTLTLSNGDKITDKNNIYKFNGVNDDTFSTTVSDAVPLPPDDTLRTDINTEYYGTDGTPTEVVGNVFIGQQNYDDTYNHEVSFFGAFGAVKDK